MFKKISDLLDYFKYIKNPIEALKFKFGFIKCTEIEIKNSSKTIKLDHVTSLNRLMGLIPNIIPEKLEDFLKFIEEIDQDAKYLVINDIYFINIFNKEFIKNNNQEYSVHLEEFFTDDEWSIIDFNGRHVIDVGGNVGDTALYFAKKGAEVISFEPVKHLHELAITNVNLNEDLLKKITLINKGVGDKNGILSYKSISVQGYVDNSSYEMEIISIQDLLKNYDFTPDILKMDCEGCEFEIILNNNLTMFNDIVFEHHSKLTGKDYKLLIAKLEKEGFKIDTYPIAVSGFEFKDIGIIHAYK